ncbi:MAG: hypothetical protein ABDH63_01770 [Candidatus Caldarchaeales archaeon]
MESVPIPGTALNLILMGLGLLLAFLGKKVLKLAAFVAAGALGALLLREALAGRLSPFLLDVVTVLAFAGLGFVGLLLLRVGAGLVLALLGYVVASSLGSGFALALLVAFIGFLVGFFFHEFLLVVASSAIGGYMLYTGLTGLGAGHLVALLLAGATVAAGILLQVGR